VAGETFIVVAEATGNAVSGKVTYDPATRRARLRPERALLPLTAYRAKITAGVKDVVGNAMTKDHEWSFQTNAETAPPKPPAAPEPGPAPGPSPPAPPSRPGR
jgi:hypothetical protein